MTKSPSLSLKFIIKCIINFILKNIWDDLDFLDWKFIFIYIYIESNKKVQENQITDICILTF
jgi:hypothetical protein